MIITIDGPTASGKSTVARIVAQQLDYYYLCSGLLFRALAYLLMNKKGYTLQTIVDPSEQDLMFVLDPHRFSYHYDNQHFEYISFDNQNIGSFLKESIIDKAASLVSTNLKVRELLCNFQRNLAKKHNTVVDGRDSGSVVFPHAEYKFFLTADVEVRANRWQLQQSKLGIMYSQEESIKNIIERDRRDSERTIAPLVIPKGALVIDTSHMNAYATADELLNIINKK